MGRDGDTEVRMRFVLCEMEGITGAGRLSRAYQDHGPRASHAWPDRRFNPPALPRACAAATEWQIAAPGAGRRPPARLLRPDRNADRAHDRETPVLDVRVAAAACEAEVVGGIRIHERLEPKAIAAIESEDRATDVEAHPGSEGESSVEALRRIPDVDRARERTQREFRFRFGVEAEGRTAKEIQPGGF